MWHILLIAPNCEFYVADGLIKHGFRVYLPEFKKVIRRGRDRRRVVLKRPLFPGYLFLLIPEDRQSLIRMVAGVRGYLRSADGLAVLSDKAISIIREIEARENVEIVNHMKIGDRVRISSGHYWYAGIVGMLKKLDKADRAVVEVMSPSRAVEVITSAAWLEPA